MRTPRPLAEADLSHVRAVFTDVDGTLNTDGVLQSATIRALEQLAEAGLPVVLVTGRPSGWGDCWVRSLPVRGVIAENGGLYYARQGSKVRKLYVQSERVRKEGRRLLQRASTDALRRVPGSRLSADSPFREVDLAIDYAEEAQLGPDAVERLEVALRSHGLHAVRSSVHVNFWSGHFNKRDALQRFAERELNLPRRQHDRQIVYVGDSFNDAPLFGALRLSIGVANVRAVLEQIDSAPAYVTRSAEGAGFREVARAVLGASATRP